MFSSMFIFCLGLLTLTRPSESQRRRQEPEVVTAPQVLEARVGESVTLPCKINNVGRRSIFWFKGDDPEGRDLVMQVKSVRGRFTVPRQYQDLIRAGKMSLDKTDLTIHHATLEDADTYTCSVAWARQSVSHVLDVIGDSQPPPEMYLSPEPQDGLASVALGLPVTLTCNAVGNPEPAVSWRKEGEAEVLRVGPTYSIQEASKEDIGRYICTAENGISTPISNTFVLTVEYVDVEAEETEVVARPEDNYYVQLACKMTGSPWPQLVWYDNEGPVREDDSHRINSEGDTYYLEISSVTADALGEYQCFGYNDKARDHSTITVSAAPSVVHILGVQPAHGQRYRMTWEVESIAPIRLYYFAYRRIDSEEVVTTSVGGSSEPDESGRIYQGSTELDLTPGMTYEFNIEAVAEEYTLGPAQAEPFTYTVPYGDYSGRSYEDDSSEEDYSDEDESDEDEYEEDEEEEEEEEDPWKWWKMTVTLVSRLPQAARALNE